jgi:hypothetical protein
VGTAKLATAWAYIGNQRWFENGSQRGANLILAPLPLLFPTLATHVGSQRYNIVIQLQNIKIN